MKKVLGLYSPPRPHWVGDGFPVRSLFSHATLDARVSPFLMLDDAGPAGCAPAVRPRGVGGRPHRGVETVTIVDQGEVEHRDSTGGGGKIGPGDVQWMTAASGILHDEFHSREFTRTGGTLEMVQLWVNLPAKHKFAQPGYQAIRSDDIPSVALPGEAGSLRVIAGAYAGRPGPARTFTPMDVWDLRLRSGKSVDLRVPAGRTLALVVLQGAVMVNDSEIAREAQLVLLDRAGTDFTLEANTDATVLVLSGEPIDEPVVAYGPFVMNSESEIRQAIEDFNQGKLARAHA
jgi:redox-sensitive bicupin YhaK (pirin superfamily)